VHVVFLERKLYFDIRVSILLESDKSYGYCMAIYFFFWVRVLYDYLVNDNIMFILLKKRKCLLPHKSFLFLFHLLFQFFI